MALDEIVQTCPVPVWLADSGGKGIQLIPVAHGEAQLRTRWRQDGAQVVLDTCMRPCGRGLQPTAPSATGPGRSAPLGQPANCRLRRTP
jgi:TraM recognition site of TraD and TraG